ncbi:MAG TPA: hypothetical protein VLB07_11390, partial [Woeseiaceae bacterium]|nr:hypothetical protein [Woeseiaceae bacterium]
MRRIILYSLVAHVALCAQNVAAQSVQPMRTERPSFSASAYVLTTGTWQVETGYQYMNDSDGADFELHTLPLALLRYGISDGI